MTGRPMVIVAGHITVDPEQRESYLAGCVSVVEQARRADGCLDFAITADLLDAGRVNLFERCSFAQPPTPRPAAA
jgi:quinol monooxygenase YgiN